MMQIKTERLAVVPLAESMAAELSRQSLDAATARFLPDEVFPTPEDGKRAIRSLAACYGDPHGPQVYAVTKEGAFIGYVQLVPLPDGWEIGYHLGEAYRGHGYITEALAAFIPAVMQEFHLIFLWGICKPDNTPSLRVLERLGFVYHDEAAYGKRYRYPAESKAQGHHDPWNERDQ